MSRRTEDLKANIWQCSHSFAGEKQERGNFSPEGEGRERKGRGVEREKIIHVIHEAISDWDGLWMGCDIEHITLLINKKEDENEKKGKEEEEEN